MTDTPARATGILCIATGIASVALLMTHPGGEAHSFAEVLKNEARNRTMDAVVHGGFIAVLALQTICYAALSASLGRRGTAGLVLFAFAAAFLSASMVLDGMATPALAARYLGAPDKIDFAKSLFVLVGTLIGVVMPLGLAFQSAAIAAWGTALWMGGTARIAGAAGIALGGAAFAAVAATAGTMNPLVLMGAIFAGAVWAVIAGVVLLRQ